MKLVQGGARKSSGSKTRSALHQCDLCIRAGEIVGMPSVLIKYPTPSVEGNSLSLKGRRHTGEMYCEACLKSERRGLYGRIGLIATYEKGKGWMKANPDELIAEIK